MPLNGRCQDAAGGGPVSLADAFRERLGMPRDPGPGVAQRLRTKFGLGQCAAKRIELYRRLERLVEIKGDLVLAIISEAVAEAVGARNPDRYFCKAVLMKLRERGYGLGARPGGDPSW